MAQQMTAFRWALTADNRMLSEMVSLTAFGPASRWVSTAENRILSAMASLTASGPASRWVSTAENRILSATGSSSLKRSAGSTRCLFAYGSGNRSEIALQPPMQCQLRLEIVSGCAKAIATETQRMKQRGKPTAEPRLCAVPSYYCNPSASGSRA
jgi:hypothetical protein